MVCSLMANNNLPAHDFAPAWLKIPTYDCHKPSGASVGDTHHTSRKDDHWLIRREREEPSSHSRYPFADSRWERDTHKGDRKAAFFPSRHQSIDIDDGQYSSSSSSSGGSSTFYPVSSLSNSQPSLLLRRPSSRHDFRDSSNTYNKGNVSHFGEVNSNGTAYGNKVKGHSPNSENRSNGTTEGVSSNNFNQEFPSLKGNSEEAKADSPRGLNGSVWENPRNAKVHGVSRKVQLVHRPLKSEFKEGRSKSPMGLNGTPSCISPKLNPQVALINQQSKLNNSSNTSNMTIFRALIPAKRQTSPLNPPTQNMEILVKNPKMRGNKSEFLKALRGEAGIKNHFGNGEEELIRKENSSKDMMLEECENHIETNGCDVTKKELDHPYENGIDINKLSVDDNLDMDSKPMLSSSLEAEQRLLREMGWKEDGSDDDAYAPLTEDELKEFRVLSEKVAQKRNGVQRNLQLNWSPKRVPPFPSVVLPPTENWSSSSDSDSDTD